MIFLPPPFAKIRYILTDPGKTKFFRMFGYSLEQWPRLQNDILTAAQTSSRINVAEKTGYGSKYVVIGSLNAPDGRDVNVTMIWFLDESESETMRFITAYAYS